MRSFFRGLCGKKITEENIDITYVRLGDEKIEMTEPPDTILDIDLGEVSSGDEKKEIKGSVSSIQYYLSTNDKKSNFGRDTKVQSDMDSQDHISNDKKRAIEKKKTPLSYYQQKIAECKKAESELKKAINLLQSYQFKKSNCFMHLASIGLGTLFAGGCAAGMVLYIYTKCSPYIDMILEPLMDLYHNTTVCIENADLLPWPSHLNPIHCDQYIQAFQEWVNPITTGSCQAVIWDNYYEIFYNEEFSRTDYLGGIACGVLSIAMLCVFYGIVACYQNDNHLPANIRQYAQRYGIPDDDILNDDLSNLLSLFREKLIQIEADRQKYNQEEEFCHIVADNIRNCVHDSTYFDPNISLLINDYADCGNRFTDRHRARIAFFSGAHPKFADTSPPIHQFLIDLKTNGGSEKVLRNIVEFAEITGSCETVKTFKR